MKSRRALLYVPGNDEYKIRKAAGLQVDGVILDLEDGVAANRKDEARLTIPRMLQEVDFGSSERLVRINPFSSGRAEDDLRAVLVGKPDAILIPKADSPELIRAAGSIITELENTHGWEPGGIAIIAIIESARAFLNLPAICASDSRLQGLIFGAEDYTADVGMTRTPGALELLYARSMLVMHTAASGLQAIDMVQTNFSDIALLEKECSEGAEMGYTGKQVIHPAQIEITQRSFTPSQIAIENALRVVEGAQAAEKEGRGAFTLDGAMVDMPVIKRAQTILARARAAGIIS